MAPEQKTELERISKTHAGQRIIRITVNGINSEAARETDDDAQLFGCLTTAQLFPARSLKLRISLLTGVRHLQFN